MIASLAGLQWRDRRPLRPTTAAYLPLLAAWGFAKAGAVTVDSSVAGWRRGPTTTSTACR